MNIGRKIYYEKSTGNVILDTGERMGDVIETTIEQDFASYTALAERVPETIGCVQLKYGQHAEDFVQCSGYRINESEQIEFSYPSDETQEPIYRKPITQELDELKAQNAKIVLTLVANDLM